MEEKPIPTSLRKVVIFSQKAVKNLHMLKFLGELRKRPGCVFNTETLYIYIYVVTAKKKTQNGV